MIDLRFQPMQERVKDPLSRARYLKSPFKGRAPMDDLERELKALDATDIVIESGHDRAQIRNDGWPRSASLPVHHDVRLFFRCKHGTLRYECNAFNSWEANLRAIGLWLQRQRLAIEEWGIGTGGEAYRGFAALPAGASSIAGAEWATPVEAAKFLAIAGFGAIDQTPVLISDGTKSGPTLDRLYREAARRAHPDLGGSDELMAKVNRARDFIEKSRA